MAEDPSALNALYARFDDIVDGRGAGGNSSEVHGEILAQLAADRRIAEGAGWTDCALERDGGLGRLRLIGRAPGASVRTRVPALS